MWHAFKKYDGEVVVEGFLELKVKDISCSGWEIHRSDDVWIFVAEKWVDSVVRVKRQKSVVLNLWDTLWDHPQTVFGGL